MDPTGSIFDTLKQLADGVTATFGCDCEVAIHDLRNVTQSLIYITGDVTRRQLGSPVTDTVIKELVKHGRSVKDKLSFKTITDDGREIKSTTLFIRDAEGEVVAAFCINFDVTHYLNALQALERFAGVDQPEQTETISDHIAFSVDQTVESVFEEAVTAIGKRPATMSTEEKTLLVKYLEDKGVFQIKGVVNQVALKLGVTHFTVYNYLKKIRAGRHPSDKVPSSTPAES